MYFELHHFLVALFILYLFHKGLQRKYNYFKKAGVNFIQPKYFFSNAGTFFWKRFSSPDYIGILYNKFPTEK